MKHLRHREAQSGPPSSPSHSVEGKGIDHLREGARADCPLSPPLYPSGDVTDSARHPIAEFVREAAPWRGVRDNAHPGRQVEEIIEGRAAVTTARPCSTFT